MVLVQSCVVLSAHCREVGFADEVHQIDVLILQAGESSIFFLLVELVEEVTVEIHVIIFVVSIELLLVHAATDLFRHFSDV